MHQTEQALERYIALERDLLCGLQTEQLINLEQGCVEVASALRLADKKSWFRFGISAILVAIVSLVLPVKVLVFGLALWGSVLLGWKPTQKNRYGLVFSMNDGSTFSVHSWAAAADDPHRLRRWHEARTAQSAQIQAQAVRLTDAEVNAMVGVEMGALARIVGRFGATAVYVAFTSVGVAAFAQSSISLFVVGIWCSWDYFREVFLASWIPPEKLDPKTPSVGESYQAVVQVLDSRGVSRSARRDR